MEKKAKSQTRDILILYEHHFLLDPYDSILILL